jgi:hypothetical protein
MTNSAKPDFFNTSEPLTVHALRTRPPSRIRPIGDGVPSAMLSSLQAPGYNGGCEAGDYSMRIPTDRFPELTGDWTSKRFESRRRHADEFTRPPGPFRPHAQPTPGVACDHNLYPSFGIPRKDIL